MNNYLFLDIDGVLNSMRLLFAVNANSDVKFENYMHELDPIAINLLRSSQQLCNFKIVISSAWRYSFTIEQFHELFSKFEWDTKDIIIDVTRREYNKSDNNGNVDIRGNQIKDWIDNNVNGAYNYVILDDSSDMLDEQMKHLVHTENNDGFLFTHYKQIAEIFRKDWHDGCRNDIKIK